MFSPGRLLSFFLLASLSVRAAEPFRIQLDTITEGYDGKYCWAQARAAAIPRADQAPIVVVMANPLLLTGSDVYYDLCEFRTEDLGQTWSSPVRHREALGRRVIGKVGASDLEEGPGDFWPQWHVKSGKVLGLGVTFRYTNDKAPVPNRKTDTIYSTYDPAHRTWSPLATLEMPAELSYSGRAACVQRYDLPNGDILLPVYFSQEGGKFSRVKVLRCSFDGNKLAVLEEGNTMSLDTKRGLAEPSITRCGGKYFLTIRHDDAGYVTTSKDGLHFAEIKKWSWDDDGTDLGTYNTQAHWVAHGDALFLVYTRRGAGNDHIFRNRAPLFIAEVDQEKLAVKRSTERILIPEKGARYGNFGICDVNENETWVVETEWMQRPPEEPVIPVNNRWGANARIYAARILWEKPAR